MQNSFTPAHRCVERIFREILPQRGLAVRESQIELCHQMLDALAGRKIVLCDAGVGIGKTHAYLVACAVWRKFGPGASQKPITISTSSVALQNAMINDYIPQLSHILLQAGILDKPLRAVVRKGKERYVCDARLEQRMAHLPVKDGRGQRRKALSTLYAALDLDATDGLSNFERRMVCVPSHCNQQCERRTECRFRRYVAECKQGNVDFQICNHNYLLADAEHRLAGQKPLLADYPALIVDEAHKLPEAALQMNTKTVTPAESEELCRLLEEEGFTTSPRRLRESFAEIWRLLEQDAPSPNGRCAFTPGKPLCQALETAACILNWQRKRLEIPRQRWLANRLEEAENTLALFANNDMRHILYVQCNRQGQPGLCAASREIPARLQQLLWGSGKPAILTSGTLAAGGHFERCREQLGLTQTVRVQEFVSGSPFDYEKNCLLYLPASAVQYKRGSEDETRYLANQILALANATHGHALVLFTSYDLMARVQALLQDKMPYPLFAMWRGGQRVLEEFRRSKNAVLLAAGPCWEGVDFPGDVVSLLVIARLPFPVPDPLSEAEKSKYKTLQNYLSSVVIPAMQSKLRQGFGRAIRTETDTCVVAILDPRAAPGQRYHEAALAALPPCGRAETIDQIQQFIRTRKGADYFYKERRSN